MTIQKAKDYIQKSTQPFILMQETLRKIDDSVSRYLKFTIEKS